MRQWKVGDRVEEVEQIGLAKIVGTREEPNGETLYQLREYAYPHRIIWTDASHIGPPTERRHDPRYEDDHWKQG